MWIAILAMAFYAMEITITDLKLSTISPRLLTLYYSAGVTIFAFFSLLISKEPISLPNPSVLKFIIFMILSSFLGATAHFFAIHDGIGTAKLSLAYSFLPIAGILYICIYKREFPNLNIILACILAGIALYLVSNVQKSLS